MRVALIAGEPSGDYLGGGLIQALRQHFPEASFEGIGGQHMTDAGLHSYYPLHELSVMGLVEVLRHLPRLLAIRRALKRRWLESPPDVFIGVDAPDFNLGLARFLRKAGIPTVQYVSPTVWAWREGRIRSIRQAVDRVLCIYPFEHDFYRQRGVPSRFVGHPLADDIPLEVDHQGARQKLGLTADQSLVALLPGSRTAEVDHLLPLFLEVASRVIQSHPATHFAIPAATSTLEHRIRDILKDHASLPVSVSTRGAHSALAAADAGLIASGTATLEAMLLGCPSLMAYRVNWMTAAIGRRVIRVPYFAMPNLMAGEMIMPEYVQEKATPEALAVALRKLLDDRGQRQVIRGKFRALHSELKKDSSLQSALAVRELLDEN